MVVIKNYKILIFITIILVAVAALSLLIGYNDSTNFVNDKRNMVFALFGAFGVILFIATYFFSYSKKANEDSSSQNKEESETDKLVTAFYKLADKVEYRNNTLLSELNEAVSANKNKSDFLMSISHELRTPMHAVLNLAEMGKAKSETLDRQKIQHFFTRIEESGERLLRLINGLLDFTRLESGKALFEFNDCNIIECISQVSKELQPISSAKNIKLSIPSTNDELIGYFDYDRIFQVLFNVISNSIKFSPENSKIEISAITTNFDKIPLKNKNCILVEVSDEGVGINEDELENIFNKFIQGNKVTPGTGGSGLGLAICREIISYHKGMIWAQNREERGTIINFVIPLELKNIKTELS